MKVVMYFRSRKTSRHVHAYAHAQWGDGNGRETVDLKWGARNSNWPGLSVQDTLSDADHQQQLIRPETGLKGQCFLLVGQGIEGQLECPSIIRGNRKLRRQQDVMVRHWQTKIELKKDGERERG